MSAKVKPEDPEFDSISVRTETKAVLAEKKGTGKTWDRYLRELAGLGPSDSGA